MILKNKRMNYHNKDFEIAPHQNFIKNFYLLIHHIIVYLYRKSLETCSAIGVAEETQKYLKYTNNHKRIIIVASPNVQENFRLQLFDDRKLKFKNNMWV